MAAFLLEWSHQKIITEIRRFQRIFIFIGRGGFNAVGAENKELKAFSPRNMPAIGELFLHHSRTRHFQEGWRKIEKGDDFHVRGFH